MLARLQCTFSDYMYICVVFYISLIRGNNLETMDPSEIERTYTIKQEGQVALNRSPEFCLKLT